MQVNTHYQSTSNFSKSSALEEVNKNLTFNEKKSLRELLAQVPDKDLSKVLNKIKEVPVDENYFQNILQKIEEAKQNSGNLNQSNANGFMIYA